MYKKFIVSFIFSLAVMLLPYQPVNAQETGKTYIQIRVDGLSCPFCAYGLEKKLKKVDGSSNLHIALEEGLVSLEVPADKKPTKASLEKVVTDAGFTPREIKFSDTPFEKANEEGK